MKNQIFNARNRCGRNVVNGVCLFSLTTFLLSCVAALPAMVVAKKSKDGVVVSAQVDVNADKVYQTALNNLEKKPELKIVEQNDEQRFVRVEKTVDGKKTQEGRLQVTAIDDHRSKMVATGNMPGIDEEAEKNLALQIIKNICEALGVKYEVVEE